MVNEYWNFSVVLRKMKMLKKARVIVLIFCLLATLVAINPQFNTEGVVIKSVEDNSEASLAGLNNPSKDLAPTNYERIERINGEKINNLQEYSQILQETPMNESVRLDTDLKTYTIIKNSDDLGLSIQNIPQSNIRLGLDLQGGTRVLLKPTEQITEDQRDNLIEVMRARLNTYGLSDIDIRSSDDLSGNKYVLVEIAGATQQEVSDLIASQGKFEAKIGNETVFAGGEEDVTFVCKNDGTCAGIRDCVPTEEGYYCKFEFQIRLSNDAAQNHARITENLDVITEANGQQYLSEKLDFYLDNTQVDSLNIGADLKGSLATSIVISGPGLGETQEEAVQSALTQMNKLQTVLLTGSFPFELEVEKIDTISPALGSAFIKNAMIAGLCAILAVSLIIFIRYRKLKIAIPMLITSLSEIVLILGFAAVAKYNLDLAAIAGIIAAVGTGVDHQIIIIDEILSKGSEYVHSWKHKLKRAFSIIFAAYLTTLAAMIPLFSAGAGLLRGFALVTIVGVSIGVFITRPAFATIIESLTQE
jgi:preprotein translocase subunit SecD